MLRHVLTIRKLGREACWLLAQQTIGMRSAKECSDFMLGRTEVLIFASLSLGERLCVTVAVRQKAGYIVYESPHASWREEICHYQRQILLVFDYSVDCLYSYGLPLSAWDMEKAAPNFPGHQRGQSRRASGARAAERLAGARHHGGAEHLRGESGLAADTSGGLSPTHAQAHTALGILWKMNVRPV